jgi:hypothetical protein
MSLQFEILADIVNQERARAFSPTEETRRSAARLLAALRCCTQASWNSRIVAALGGRPTVCCVTG